MQKVRQRLPFQLPKAESTRSLCSAGDELKRKKIDCHFFRQQHLPASAAASGEIPCCLRKCPAELQGTQSTEEGLAPCVPVVWECSTFMELPARQPGSARSMKPTTISPGKKRGEKRSRNKAWLWNWKWRDVPGERGRGVPDLARAEVQGMEVGVEHPAAPPGRKPLPGQQERLSKHEALGTGANISACDGSADVSISGATTMMGYFYFLEGSGKWKEMGNFITSHLQ